jgi:phosphotransferase system enzyme I (PtsI)
MTDTVDSNDHASSEIVLHGIGVSPGVVEGDVFLVGVESDHVTEKTVAEHEVLGEVSRFEDALIETRRQLRDIQKSLEQQMKHSDISILDAHLMVLDDRAMVEEVLQHVTERRMNAEAAMWDVANKYADALSKVDDDYLRERVADIRDVARRVVRNLSGKQMTALSELSKKSIIVARDLAPSETAALPRGLALGFATDLGSPTSHSAMMARAMEIPAVVGMHDVTSRISSGQKILIDGNKGIVIVNPTAERLEVYGKVAAERKHIQSDLTNLKDEPAQLKGGRRIALRGNIEMPSDIDAIREYGAEGVGLFRSEYVYMSSQELPSEDELAVSYTAVAEALAPAPVTIRTLDIGGDKFAPYMGLPTKANPFLGLRSIRISLAEPEIFKVQLRAILRASAAGNMRVLYPMISSADEVIRANELLDDSKTQLRSQGVEFDEDIKVGVMIETPSAALTSDIIAPHTDFFSLGTNDLIQYAIAVDRVNEQVAYLYQPTHPAILRLISKVVQVARTFNKDVGVCGEMAADPLLCPLLVGMGVNEVSIPPSAVPVVKDAIRSLTQEEVTDLADSALAMKSAGEVMTLCRSLIQLRAPEILELTG